jgi:Domain of unknown function (DUF4157)
MQKSQFLTALRDALLAGCDAELAPFGRTAKDCPYILRTIDRYSGRGVPSVLSAVQAFGHPAAGASANELIDAVMRNARTVARRLAEKHGSRLQAATESGDLDLPSQDLGLIRSQLSGGRPLDAAVRERMQHALGHSFESVLVHDDSSAARLSAGLGARAFTIGHDIAFAAGQYRPGTDAGETLIAHELSHTVQQGASASPSGRGGAEDYRGQEQEADRAAAAAARDGTTAWPSAGQTGPRVQRWPAVVVGLELGADALVVTEVATVTPAEVVVVDGALVLAESAAPALVETLAPAALESLAPAALETVAPAALETVAPAAVASSSSALSTAATVAGVGVAATTLSSDSPTEQDKRRDCMRDHPYALPCEEEIPLDEQVIDWIMRQGYGYESLGDCSGQSSFGPGVISACNGAPGESWHCDVAPYFDPVSRTSKPGGIVSVFSCLCCRADGTVGYEWRPDHWSPGAP